MRSNPERLAWVVLSLAFGAFCLLAGGIPLGVHWYLRSAQVERKASVESLGGTVVVEPPTGRGPIPLTKGESAVIPAGSIVHVDEKAEAVITFNDYGRGALPGSFVRMFPGSTLVLERLNSPRYGRGTSPNTVHLQLSGGRLSLGTTLSPDLPLDFQVTTLQGTFKLAADGNYQLEADNARSEITAYLGQATVVADAGQVNLGPGQRTSVDLGQPPQPATSAARNLVVNGDFSAPLDQGWRVFNDQGADGGSVDGSVEVVVDEERRAAKFLRTGGHGDHCETVLEQTMNEQLDVASSLVFRAAVKVRSQSLSGGGYLSSEYPLMIRITYRDAYDSEAEWVQGFYFENEAGNPTTYGQQIPGDRWYPFESGNLLEDLPVKPYKIIKLRIYASGWDYESLISDVSLMVE